MSFLICFQIAVLPVGFFAGGQQEGIRPAQHYHVTMYKGIPQEALPEEIRNGTQTEEALLTAHVDADGQFHAEREGMMFKGRLLNLKDGKAELRIDRSRLYTTSCFPIADTVKLNEAAIPKGCLFGSVIFSYYFRIRKADEENRQKLKKKTPNKGMHLRFCANR